MPNYTDGAVANLREIVAVINREIGHVPSADALHTAWGQLVEVLALGPAPETRECPTCHGIGMQGAKRCGRCWAALIPVPVPG